MILAPMEDVTDTVFRRIVASCAPPDVYVTEFTSVNGLFSRGFPMVAQRLMYTEGERPIVGQVWGHDPGIFYKAAQFLVERGFDGIDINMGCPVKNVTSSGAGACLIQEPQLVKEIIDATKRGIHDVGSTIPFSIKTRIGYKKIATEEWISHLLSCDIDALIIHGRTAAEMSKVPAHWDEIGRAVKLRDAMGKKTLIIGNGDVTGYADAMGKVAEIGVDGVMIGRGIFHNLWAFEKTDHTHVPTQEERFAILKKHVELFDATWGKAKNFAVMKKFFKMYIQGFDNASDIRVRFMECSSASEVLSLLSQCS